MSDHVIEVCGLRVELAGGVDVVDDVSFAIDRREVLGLVGESGSGKTTVATAVLGHARRGARVTGGSVVVDGRSIRELAPAELRAVRGAVVGYVPQDPSAALNPAIRIGAQLEELFQVHGREPDRDRIRQVLDEARLPSDDQFLRRYPHQLSGGQQQRVMIASAFLLRPPVIVLDEPTTGLDVTTQAHVLATIRELCGRYEVAALYVTHDLAVIANLADRIVVMYAGRTAEVGTRGDVFASPTHPYTRKLLGAVPQLDARRRLEPIPGHQPPPDERPAGCSFAPRCPFVIDRCRAAEPELISVRAGHAARCIRAHEVVREGPVAPLGRPPVAGDAEPILTLDGITARHGDTVVLDGVSLAARARECLALVGESGSGKTTLSRVVVGLHRNWTGDLRLRGVPLAPQPRDRPAEVRRTIQYIFQSPHSSLNPRRTVGEAVAEPLRHFFGLRGAALDERVAELFGRVSLTAQIGDAHPAELSGGERQRVAIARALAAAPEILICDEVTSALDVSVQASIIELLAGLQESEHLTLLFITHNLPLVRSIADRIVVLREGRLVEQGAADEVLGSPADEYTQELLRDTPSFSAARPPAVAR